MIYLLLLLLMFSLYINYLIFEKDVLSPSVMTCISFLLSLLILIANESKWNVDISFKTVVYIMLSIFSLALGEIFARNMFNKYRRRNIKKYVEKENKSAVETFNISGMFTIILSVIFIAVIYLTYINIGRVASVVNDGNTLLGNYRKASELGYSIPSYLIIVEKILGVVSYVYIYVFIYNAIIKSEKRYLDLLPIILYFFLTALSSNRSQYIYYFTTILVMIYILYQRKSGWKLSGNLKFIRMAIIAMAAFFMVFISLGNFTGKSERYDNPFDNVSIYAGASIPALSLYLENYKYDPHNFGKNTLAGLSNILSRFGVDFKSGDTDVAGMVQVSTTPLVRTNVFTCIKEYLHDYGTLGLIIIRFITGFFYTYIYIKIKRNLVKNESKSILIFSIIYYPLVTQFISEGFLRYIFTVTTALQIIIALFLLSYFRKKKRIKIVI